MWTLPGQVLQVAVVAPAVAAAARLLTEGRGQSDQVSSPNPQL